MARKVNPGGPDIRKPAKHKPKPEARHKKKRVIKPGGTRRVISPQVTATTSPDAGSITGQEAPAGGYGDTGASGDLTGTAGQSGIGRAYLDSVYGTGTGYAPEYHYVPMPAEQAAQSAITQPTGDTGQTGGT